MLFQVWIAERKVKIEYDFRLFKLMSHVFGCYSINCAVFESFWISAERPNAYQNKKWVESSLKWADSEMKTKLNTKNEEKQQLFRKKLNAERRDVCIILVLMLSFIAPVCIHSVCIIWRSYVCFVCSGYRILWWVFVVFVVEASRRFWTAHYSAYHLENSIYATLYTRHLHRFQLFVLVWETQKMAMLLFHSLMDNIFLCVLLCFLTLSCFLFNSLRFFSESCEFKRLLIHIILHNTSAFFK